MADDLEAAAQRRRKEQKKKKVKKTKPAPSTVQSAAWILPLPLFNLQPEYYPSTVQSAAWIMPPPLFNLQPEYCPSTVQSAAWDRFQKLFKVIFKPWSPHHHQNFKYLVSEKKILDSETILNDCIDFTIFQWFTLFVHFKFLHISISNVYFFISQKIPKTMCLHKKKEKIYKIR